MMAFEEGSEGLLGYGEQTRQGLLDRRGRVCNIVGRSVYISIFHSIAGGALLMFLNQLSGVSPSQNLP